MKRITLFVLISTLFWGVYTVHKQKDIGPERSKVMQKSFAYQAKFFDLEEIPFLSKSQREQHYTLYKGYVNKLNEIRQKVVMAQRSPGITYSEYRGLKIAETCLKWSNFT
jgi:hypothetical protein